jgi:tetratricopeptide (TPR) repeat protein
VLAHHLGDQAAVARAQYWLGYINYALGESREAIHHCDLASAAAHGAGDDPLAVQIRATLGQAKTAACDYEGALPLLDEAIDIKRRHRSGSRPAVGLAFSLVCRGWVLGDRGEFDAAYGCFDDATASVLGVTHEIGASIEGWHAAVLLWQGRWADAHAAAAESTRIAEQTRSLFQFCMGRAMVAQADWMQTRDVEALQRVQQATAWLEPREGALFRSLNHGWLAEGLMSTGRLPEARRHAARALVRGRSGDLIGVAMAYRALAEEASAAGNRARAKHYIGLALRVARTRGSAHETATTQLCAAGIAMAFGERSRAIVLLDTALPAFERMAMRWHLGEARKLAGEA